ncbi:hypothetical protein CARUB_v10012158mg [Capsella rubella]|uniref:At2g29880-like C-terminal domain-containing protein n=1 Tax=Capsella rubella TaxID=81985 RepID=R0GTQ8_9BRAS|nr:hypothetical protein CARUB_v10012158mg [Capsella rubella]
MGLKMRQSFFCQLLDSLRFSSGFGWDPEKKKFTPTYEVWDDFMKIFGMIQRRWEKETEEKEFGDKANNVWDGIKEILDLTDDMRNEAMTLVHSLGMKFGFVHISIEERKGWII